MSNPDTTNPNGDNTSPTNNQNTNPSPVITQDDDKTRNFEALRKAKEEEEKRAKKLEAELNRYKEAEAEAEKKKLEEQGEYQKLVEQLRKEKEDAENRLKEKERKLLLDNQLKKAGINDELLNFVTPSLMNQIQFDDSNHPTNLEEVIKGLKTSSPSLFGKPTPNFGNTSIGTTPTGNGTSMTREEAIAILNKPDASEAIRRQKEIREALAKS